MRSTPNSIRKKHELAEQRGIDMTPMIDVVFQLILFFMLTSALVRPNQIELDLPESSSGVKADQDQTLVVTYNYVDGQPQVKLNNEPVGDLDQLGEALLAAADPKQNPPVNVMFDKEVPMQDGVEVMDVVRGAGFQRFSIQTVAAEARGFERAMEK